MIKAGEMVHVGMRDEDVAHPQKLEGDPTNLESVVRSSRPAYLVVPTALMSLSAPIGSGGGKGHHLTPVRGPIEFIKKILMVIPTVS